MIRPQNVDRELVLLCKLLCVVTHETVMRPVEGVFCETWYTLMAKG